MRGLMTIDDIDPAIRDVFDVCCYCTVPVHLDLAHHVLVGGVARLAHRYCLLAATAEVAVAAPPSCEGSNPL